MADIHDLKEERTRKEAEKFLQDIKSVKKIAPDIDVCHTKTHFTGHVMGSGGTDNDRLRLIIYDVSGASVRPVGAIRIRRDQWEAFKKMGDQLLEAHAQVGKKEKSTEP